MIILINSRWLFIILYFELVIIHDNDFDEK